MNSLDYKIVNFFLNVGANLVPRLWTGDSKFRLLRDHNMAEFVTSRGL